MNQVEITNLLFEADHIIWVVYLTYGLSLLFFTITLLGGAYVLYRALRSSPTQKNDGNSGTSGNDILVEYVFAPNGEMNEKFSFSRFAGAIGAIGFAAVFVSLGFWVLCGLFLVPSILSNFDMIGNYLFAAAVFFFPYTVNQITARFSKPAKTSN